MASALQAFDSGVRFQAADSGGSGRPSAGGVPDRGVLRAGNSQGALSEGDGTARTANRDQESFAGLVRGMTPSAGSTTGGGNDLPASGNPSPGSASASDAEGDDPLAGLRQALQGEDGGEDLLAALEQALQGEDGGEDLLAALKEAIRGEEGSEDLLAALKQALDGAGAGDNPLAALAQALGSGQNDNGTGSLPWLQNAGLSAPSDGPATSSSGGQVQSLAGMLAGVLKAAASDQQASANTSAAQRLVSGLERLANEATGQQGEAGSQAQRLLSALERLTGEAAGGTGKGAAVNGQANGAVTESLERLMARVAQGNNGSSAGTSGSVSLASAGNASGVLSGAATAGIGLFGAAGGDGAAGSLPTLGQSMTGTGGILSQGSQGVLSFGALGVAGRGGAGEQSLANRVVWMSSNRLEQAEFKMHPPQLGSVSVRLRFENDQANLVFQAPNAQVREAIEQSLPRLRDQLAEQGITLGDASVSDGEPESGDERDYAGWGAYPDSASDAAPDIASDDGDARATTSLSLVDRYA